MEVLLDTNSIDDYRLFLKIKQLPTYSFQGRLARFPDEYNHILGGCDQSQNVDYEPKPFLFDYQGGVSRIAIRKQKFAIFAKPGLGKTLMYMEYIRHVASQIAGRGLLMFTPLMVLDQTMEECQKFYGTELPIEVVESRQLDTWLKGCAGRIGVTNYEALKNHCDRGQLGAIVADEFSLAKSAYGKYAAEVIRLGRGLTWKLLGTGTPAPNDRIEYANYAVFLDQYPTVNSFLSKFFINRGQTSERWELRPHAIEPFYRALSHWCIFLTNPAAYGWKDNCDSLPKINVHIQDIDMTASQQAAVRKATGCMFATKAGGITKRSMFSKIAKGLDGSKTLKFDHIKSLVDSWPSESTIIWAWYNDEQDILAEMFPDAANIDGSTPHNKRRESIADFQAGRRKVLLSKAKVLGYGLNLQIATKMIFSSLKDSYEEYFQCIKRANRTGSTHELDVYIPIVDVERPFVDNVLRKAAMVQQDEAMQEKMFRKVGVIAA